MVYLVGHMNTNSIDNQKQLLQQCLQQIEDALQWPPAKDWRHNHFEQLSEKIQQKTNVLLSITTLKRVWGKVNYQSSPSITTLDALSQFLDYKDWISFQNDSLLHLREIPNPDNNPKKSRITPYWWPIALLAIILSGITLFTLSRNTKAAIISGEGVSFDFQPVSKGLPNTVTFTYDAKHIQADSFFIQQSWDPRLRHSIGHMNDFHAVTYYYPGLFKSKLIANESILLEKDLLIPSEGWLGVIRKNPVPYYLNDDQIMKGGVLAIEPELITQKGFNLDQEIPATNLYLVGEFEGANADNFSYKTSFKNLRTGNDDICQHTYVVLYTTAGVIVVPFSIKGCTAELNLIMPQQTLIGQRHDLTAFGVDFSDWIVLEVSKQNGDLRIVVNDQVLFQDQVKMNFGKIEGVKYTFNGGGAIQSVQLEADGKISYKSDFKSLVQAIEPN